MARRYRQPDYGFGSRHPHPAPSPLYYPADDNFTDEYAQDPVFPPPQRQYQQNRQQRARNPFHPQQQRAPEYERPRQGQRPYPVPSGYRYRPASYVHEPPRVYEQGQPHMSSIPTRPERYRRPTVTFEYTPQEPVEGEHTSHPQPRRTPFRNENSERLPMQEHRPATIEDAKDHGIPSNWVLTYWDPTEKPFVVLHMVFDANSLGKRLFDWTIGHYGPQHSFTEAAEQLWPLLIQLAGKINKAEERLRELRGGIVKPSAIDEDILQDFVDYGERQMEKLQKLLEQCEGPALKLLDVVDGYQGQHRAYIELVEALFSRERNWKATEEFMGGLELWISRFDRICDPILDS